jgi:hypothetical protein
MAKPDQVGRLAFRVEGEFWNAYYARADSMKDAMLLGSLHMRLASLEPSKRQFMALMQSAFTVLFKDATGATLAWPEGPQPAPEHERSRDA